MCFTYGALYSHLTSHLHQPQGLLPGGEQFQPFGLCGSDRIPRAGHYGEATALVVEILCLSYVYYRENGNVVN